MKTMFEKSQKLGVMIVGLGGAVATTAVAGIELLKLDAIGTEGLPMSQVSQELIGELPDYESLIFGGWDLSADDLSKAAATHNVLTLQQFQAVTQILSQIKPLPAVGNREFCANISCDHCTVAENHREAIEILRQNMRDFQTENQTDALVLINLASTERFVDQTSAVYSSLKYFEQALDSNAPEVSPAMIYAYAAIAEGVPYGNFTPSVAADIPALVEFAKKMQVPIAGKDGKTGQTMMKTVVAPAFKTRALKVDGWYSTNILGQSRRFGFK
jgi:myo-inositol-1-phosphate synthase